jgi:rhodanese-related sulfurtransferase
MYKIVNLVCSISIPLEKIMKGEEIEEIEEGRDVYVMCRRGVASREAA